MSVLGNLWDEFSVSNLVDNAELLYAAADDALGNVDPLDPRFASGTAPATAVLAETQNAAAQGRAYDPSRARTSAGILTPEEQAQADAQGIDTGLGLIGDASRATEGQVIQGADEALAAGKVALERSGQVLEFLTRPWVLTLLGVVIIAAVAAPYIAPLFKAAAKKGAA